MEGGQEALAHMKGAGMLSLLLRQGRTVVHGSTGDGGDDMCAL